MTSTAKSSSKPRHQILAVISKQRAERLLRDWANMPESDPTEIYRRYLGRNPEEVRQLDTEGAYRRMLHHYPEIFPAGEEVNSIRLLRIFGTLLRKAWRAPDERQRNWYLADAESSAHKERSCYTSAHTHIEIERFKDPPPQPTVLEALLYYLRRNAQRLLRCPNPDCPAPYFLSTKKGQKYCSTACARPAQLESKRRWWSEHRKKLKEEKER